MTINIRLYPQNNKVTCHIFTKKGLLFAEKQAFAKSKGTICS
jgi:hypothetical protein